MTLPHPIPYQGSKRKLADAILALAPARCERLFEPFAGSAATSIAAAKRGLADAYHVNDLLAPLAGVWRQLVADPEPLADAYEALWHAQRDDPRAHYLAVRDAFNAEPTPARLLYLLARCVKNAVRFNAEGGFNQSADHRRRGRRPDTMRRHLRGAHALLQGRTRVSSVDYAEALADATSADFVYLDPPYMGTSHSANPRYVQGLDLERFVSVLADLQRRGVPLVISFDGRHGERRYGPALPDHLGLRRLEIHAGRSSQATLNGRVVHTWESLYTNLPT